MLNIKLEVLVAALVRQELQEKNGNDKALHFHFSCTLGYYTPNKSYDQRRALHLLYYLKPGYNSISVFSAVLPSGWDKIDKVVNWKHETTHDSEWRSIHTFADVYFGMATAINEAMLSDGLPEVAPITMTEYNSFPLFHNRVYDWQTVEVSKDPTDDYNYRKLVKVIL